MDTPIFAALADPMRRQLLATLAEHGPKTATQLATEYPITRQAILKHLALLAEADLVTVQQQGREKRYTLTPAPLGAVEAWVKAINSTWQERLLRLKLLLEAEETDDSRGVT